jgi:hypothetical protein
MLFMSVAEAPEPKVDDLVSAVRTLDRAHRKWQNSDEDRFPEYLVAACGAVSVLVTSGFPKDDRLIGLFLASVNLANSYQAVLLEEDGSERGLMAAIEKTTAHLDSIDAADEAPPQSAASMMVDWKTAPQRYTWIARAFGEYDADADLWSGPLFAKNGTPRQDLIDKEVETPGSVLGDNYRPASQRLKVERLRTAAMKQLANIQAGLFRPEGGAVPEKATVLEMLQDGQFADVIAKVKRVSIAEVLEIARANGIAVSNREEVLSRASNESHSNPMAEARGYKKPSFDDEPVDDFYADDDQDLDVDTTEDPLDVIANEPPRVAGKITKEELSEFVLGFLSENPEASQHDILAAAVTTTGKDVSRQMLTPILKQLKEA